MHNKCEKLNRSCYHKPFTVFLDAFISLEITSFLNIFHFCFRIWISPILMKIKTNYQFRPAYYWNSENLLKKIHGECWNTFNFARWLFFFENYSNTNDYKRFISHKSLFNHYYVVPQSRIFIFRGVFKAKLH